MLLLAGRGIEESDAAIPMRRDEPPAAGGEGQRALTAAGLQQADLTARRSVHFTPRGGEAPAVVIQHHRQAAVGADRAGLPGRGIIECACAVRGRRLVLAPAVEIIGEGVAAVA